MKTSRPHFEELDWLNYAQDVLDPDARATLTAHLGKCTPCQERLASLRRLAAALPHLQEHLASDDARSDDHALIDRLERQAERVLEGIGRAHHDLEAWRPLPPPEEFATLSEEHVAAALQSARELFGPNLARAEALVRWAAHCLALLQTRGNLAWPGLEGVVGSYAAYLSFRAGQTTRALAELAGARPLLDRALPLRDLELAFWSYVRAACLRDLSRFREGLDEIETAESIYEVFGDRRRLVRARVLHAILLCDAGAPAEALPIHEQLIKDPDAIADQPTYALLYLSYATNLVFATNLAGAKIAYARTTKLLRSTGQEDQLFRVRVGLADIAHHEGRFADALAINLELRPEFGRRHLPWDEVRRELWIIRELLELERFAEARETCQALERRAEAFSLRSEAQRALSYLATAERHLDVPMVAAVQDDLQRILRGDLTRWTAA